MKRVLLGMLMVFGLIGTSEAQNYTAWYAQNPIFNSITLTGGLITGMLNPTGTATFVSSVTVLGNRGLQVTDQITTKTLLVSGTGYMAGHNISATFINGAYVGYFTETDNNTGISGTISDDTMQIMAGGVTMIDLQESTADILRFWPGVDASTWTATRLALNGDIQISSRPCASFEYFLNQSSVTEIAANTFVVLCGTGTLQTSSAWFNTALDTQGNSNRVTYAGANTHKFLIQISACITDFTATDTTVSLQLRKGGNLINLAETSPYIAVQNKDVTFSISTIATMATNEYIELWGTTNDGDDLAIDHAQITIVPLD